MERKKRNLMVVLIAAVIVVAILASFGLRLFVPDTAKIVLPTPAASASPGLEPGTGSGLVRVDVTPETVQTVIGQTLTRPESYFREVTIEDFWGDGEQSSTTARVWVDGGWTMTESAMADGAIRHTIVGEGQFWLWYDGDRTPVTGPADDRSADLEGQRIPTYEDVLSLDTADIAAAGYEERGGLACVWTQTAPDALGYVETYWVAVDSGLLVSAETTLDGTPQQQEQPQGDHQLHVVPLQKEEQQNQQQEHVAGVQPLQFEPLEQPGQAAGGFVLRDLLRLVGALRLRRRADGGRVLLRDAGVGGPVGNVAVIHRRPPFPCPGRAGRPPGSPGPAWRSGLPDPAWRTAPA